MFFLHLLYPDFNVIYILIKRSVNINVFMMIMFFIMDQSIYLSVSEINILTADWLIRFTNNYLYDNK